MKLPEHNERFDSVWITLTSRNDRLRTFVVRDAIIWIQDNETIDIAQYGQNESSAIVYVDEIEELHRTNHPRKSLTIKVHGLSHRTKSQ